jgi:hypothetical protein
MIRRLLSGLLLLSSLVAGAQEPVEGTTYFLPKTRLNFSVLVEKSSFTPGQFAGYSERYMKEPIRDKASVAYRIVGIKVDVDALPDASKRHTITLDKKHSIFTLDLDKNGVLRAINATAHADEAKSVKFVSAVKSAPLDPTKFMSQDILSAGNSAKMAELTAQEIYDIRDSRNQLSRGEADFMPKDGEQLKIMLNNLATQEKALMQTFTGVTMCDTTEHQLSFVPMPSADSLQLSSKQLLFRFSKHLGLVDADDLAGSPYYIKVTDERVVPSIETLAPNEKKKELPLIYVNLPGKIKVALLDESDNILKQFETNAAQYGKEEGLSANLFGKKFTTHIVLDPVSGNVKSMKTEPID